MFSEDQTIHFSCNKCGKCCTKSPDVNLYEIFNLAEDFVFQMNHNSAISYTKNPLDKKDTDYYKMISHSFVLPEIDAILYYYTNITTVEYPNLSCSKLKDNLCSIHHKRPAACMLSPFNEKYEDTNQLKVINIYKENTDKKLWDCNFSDDAPIIYQNNEIYSNHQNSIYFQNIKNNRDFTDKYIEYLQNIGEDNLKVHIKNIMSGAINKSEIVSDMVVPLYVAYKNNMVSEEMIIDFIKKQIILIEESLKKSSIFKLKTNLKVSRLYKVQLESYNKALKNNLFKTDFDII